MDAFVSFLGHGWIDEFCRLLKVRISQTQLYGCFKLIHSTSPRAKTWTRKSFDLPCLNTIVPMHRGE